MSLDPRAVALLGIGYATGLVARIGLWDAPEQNTNLSGGGRLRPHAQRPPRRPDDDESLLIIIGAI